MKREIGARLRLARVAAGFRTAKEFAERHNIPQPTYSMHEAGERGIKPDVAASYAEKLNVSSGWILTGQGKGPVTDFQETDLSGFMEAATQSFNDNLAIMEVDVRGSAGPGLIVETEEPTGSWHIPRDVVRSQTKTPVEGLRMITVSGDSMDPTLLPGQRILVDTTDLRPSPPGVFVVWDGVGLVIKRVEVVAQSNPPKIRLSSDNARYPTYERDLSDVHIQGRVIGQWRWM